MRKILLFALFLSSLLWNAAAHAQERCVEVTLTEAGTLEEVMADRSQLFESIYVSGPMDGWDIEYIRYTSEKYKRLLYVDLSNATFKNDSFPEWGLSNSYTITEIKLPDSLKKIGERAFYSTSIRKINLPNSLEEMGEMVFEQSEISGTLTIPEGVKKIPDSAFLNTDINFVRMFDVEEIGDLAFSQIGVLRLFPLNDMMVKRIGKGAFKKTFFKYGVQTLDLSKVEFIDEEAFYGAFVSLIFADKNGNSVLEEIAPRLNKNNKRQPALRLGRSIRKIGEEAFSGNSNLRKLIFFTDKIDEIGIKAFEYTSIDTLALPKETGVLRSNAFADIPTLKEIYCPCAVPPVNEDAFGGLTPNDIPVYIPVGTLEAYRNAPGWDYFTNFVEFAGFPGQSGIEDAVADGADAVRVYAEGGRLRITGVEPGTRYTVYTVDGAMISSGIAEAPAALPAGAVYVVKVDGKGYKVKI